MSENPTNFYSLRTEFVRMYTSWKMQNPKISPTENEDFMHSAMTLFDSHHFFSDEMYKIYNKKIHELAGSEKPYTKAHHKMMAIELMRDWIDETVEILNIADKVPQ